MNITGSIRGITTNVTGRKVVKTAVPIKEINSFWKGCSNAIS